MKFEPFLMDLQLFSETGEVADPQDDNVDPVDDVSTGETGAVADPQRTSKQDPEVDAAFAKMRRENEALSNQLKSRDKWIEQSFGSMGIKTWDQYIQAIEQQNRQQQEAQWREQGVDPEIIREILKNDPEFKMTKQELEQYKQQIKQQQVNSELENEFQELAEEHGDTLKELGITSWKELVNLPNYKDFENRVGRGYSLLDAFESVNRASIRKKSQEKIKQKTLNTIAGKSHLKTEADGADQGGDVNIPTETLQQYLDMGFTKEQAYKHYSKLYK